MGGVGRSRAYLRSTRQQMDLLISPGFSCDAVQDMHLWAILTIPSYYADEAASVAVELVLLIFGDPRGKLEVSLPLNPGPNQTIHFTPAKFRLFYYLYIIK